MVDTNMDWVGEREKKLTEERSKEYFNIVEGKQEFVLLSHCAQLIQVWDNAKKKYRPAEEGDKNTSVKGVCWVLQDGIIKQAKLPYTVVKAIRDLRDIPDWEFTIPFPHTLTLTATGAGTIEVEYSVQPSPKKVTIDQAILDELAKKMAPEAIVERIKGAKDDVQVEPPTPEEAGIKPEDIPF